MALVDAGRMLTMRKEFVSIECTACSSSSSKFRFEKLGLTYVMCTVCKTMYVNPRPSREVLEWFYSGSVLYPYWNEYIFPASEKTRRAKIVVPRVDKVLEICDYYKIRCNSLLEIGSGFGTFCLELKSRGRFKKIVGVEPTHDLAQNCREKGLEIIEKTFEGMECVTDKFDVVVSFEVIEHVFSPRQFIIHCHKLLRRGGLFIASCPNGRGFDFLILGSLCANIDHEHLNYLNPESFTILLKSQGLEVLEVLTPGQLDAELVRNRILSGELDISHDSFLHRVLIENWPETGKDFQNFISRSGLSSNMLIMARKL